LKRKRVIWWMIAVALFCLVVTMFIVLVSRSQERGTSVELGLTASEEKPATTRNNAVVSVFPNTANVIQNTTKQNQSVWANQTNTSVVFGNLTDPKVCIQQWREELMTMEDTLRCIDRYMEKKDKNP